MGKNTFGYIPVTEKEQEEMLKEIGVSSMDELFAHIPDEVKLSGELQIPSGMTELEVRRKIEGIAEKNRVFPVCFRGAGAYRHFIAAIR